MKRIEEVRARLEAITDPSDPDTYNGNAEDNGKFIAHAPGDVAYLLRIAESARAVDDAWYHGTTAQYVAQANLRAALNEGADDAER